MSIFKWLQVFADGASGGDGGGEGAATGVEAADAGRTLEDLGVPKDRAERFREKRAKRQQAQASAHDQGKTDPPEAEGQQAKNQTDDAWEAFFQIPENKQRLQSMMAERGKAATDAKKAADAQSQKVEPLLDLMSKRYNIEAKDGKYDVDAIVKAATGDDLYFEDRALENGESIDEAKTNWQKDYEAKQQQREQREQQLQQHFYGMQKQAEALREIFPNFDLQQALQDPVFLKRTSPEVGMSVEDAFYSMHHGEIMQQQAEAIARRAKVDAAASIRSGIRPRENGASASATASAAPNMKNMTREQRLAYIKGKYSAAPK